MRIAAWIVALAVGGAVAAQVELPETHRAALRALAPGGVIERHVVVVDEAAHARLCAELGDASLPRTWFVYVARVDGAVVRIALFDTHLVRTLRETLLIGFDLELRLGSVDVVAFAEPRRFLPKSSYYARYQGRTQEDLAGRGIDGVSGATLTSGATARSAVRGLAFGDHLRATGVLETWAAAIPAAVRAAAGPAVALATARLRERSLGAEIRPRTRLTATAAGAAWVVALEVVRAGRVLQTAYLHTAMVGEVAVSTLVTRAADGEVHAEAMSSDHPVDPRAAVAVRSILAEVDTEPGR